MTEGMILALVCMQRNGAVWAGRGNETAPGCVVSVPAASVRALVSRGYAEFALSVDGGACARPVGR